MPAWKPDPQVHRGRGVIDNLHVHPVFVTTYRRPVVTDELRTQSEQLMHEVWGDRAAELREFNGETHHPHLLVHHPPSLALSLFVNRLKGVSSRRLRQENPSHVRQYLWGSHFWSPSHFAGSCGGAPLSIVKDHIEHQKRTR